jgi:putative IMPACT (imprinted ancient) family translation regulator
MLPISAGRWAYRIGHQYRFSDGGEPGGTAGQPIMRAIEGQALDHVAIGVIRYFGGTLLGAGGLMRAYGGAAAEALKKAGRIQESPAVEIVIETPFQWSGAVHHLLERHAAVKRQESFTERGVSLICQIPASGLNAFQDALRGATHAQVLLRIVSTP